MTCPAGSWKLLEAVCTDSGAPAPAGADLRWFVTALCLTGAALRRPEPVTERELRRMRAEAHRSYTGTGLQDIHHNIEGDFRAAEFNPAPTTTAARHVPARVTQIREGHATHVREACARARQFANALPAHKVTGSAYHGRPAPVRSENDLADWLQQRAIAADHHNMTIVPNGRRIVNSNERSRIHEQLTIASVCDSANQRSASRSTKSKRVCQVHRTGRAFAAATVAVAAAEAAAQHAAAGESDVDPLTAEHDLSNAKIALASAIRVRDAAAARHAKTERNLTASENVAWRPVAIAAGRARLAACEKSAPGCCKKKPRSNLTPPTSTRNMLARRVPAS